MNNLSNNLSLNELEIFPESSKDYEIESNSSSTNLDIEKLSSEIAEKMIDKLKQVKIKSKEIGQ